MVGKQQVWVLDVPGESYRIARDELAKQDVTLTTFASAEEMMTAARSAHARLPRLLVVDAGYMDSLLAGTPSSAPRAALLRHAPFILAADDGRAGVAERAQAFGAVATVRKPLDPQELVATITRCLAEAGQVGAADEIGFNVGTLSVALGASAPVTLTPREFQILSLLYKATDRSATRAHLFANVWADVKVCNKVLDVHVSKLRKKLQPLGVGIAFLRPAGYKLELGGSAAAASTASESVPVPVPLSAAPYRG